MEIHNDQENRDEEPHIIIQNFYIHISFHKEANNPVSKDIIFNSWCW